MRILWHSNAPWAPTGYGQQTGLMCPRIKALGHEVGISAFWGLQGGILNMGGIPVYPRGQDVWGNDILPAHAEHFRADIVITLMDAWVLKPPMVTRVRWCPWLPIDHDPIPPPVHAAVKLAWQPIAYSKFGQAAMKEVDISAEYVPHGIDTRLFAPRDKETAREKIGLPKDAFLVGMVAANKGNPSRKGFVQAFQAFATLREKHTDAVLYAHTHASDMFNGVNLTELVDTLGIHKDAVIFADQYQYQIGYPPQYLADLYSAIDVLLNASMGEGFGLPIVEAQACGTPVIISNWTSMPELCFAGWKVEGLPFYTPQASWQMMPAPHLILGALEASYNLNDSQRKRLSKKARNGAANYDVDAVADRYWKPVLAKIEAEISQGGELKMVDFAA